MSYKEWFYECGELHNDVVRKLLEEGYSKEGIISFFEFSNISKQKPNFCPLFEEERKCHDVESLNCYLCGCPYFEFDDGGLEHNGGKTIFSRCAIGSRFSSRFETEGTIHQDCSNCFVPHRSGFVKKHFEEDWFLAMKVNNKGANEY